ncbi:MAG: InlB B-repeat-containing protein, partial [Treponema sp.]|nr:InlB B-repeat-containing protein [Treponema sp.]
MKKLITIFQFLLAIFIIVSCTNVENNSELPQEASYTVEYWQENIDDDGYTKVISDTETKTGISKEKTEAEAKIYSGFTAQTFEQAVILADGSTVIKIYYKRNTITYTFNSGEGKFSDNTTSKTVSGKYGAQTAAPSDLERTGYAFENWNPQVPETFGTLDLNFTATWKEGASTYKVEHYQQNIENDEYTLVSEDTEIKSGITGDLTDAQVKEYPGFIEPSNIQNDFIAADASTVVKLYYDRKEIYYSFYSGEGKFSNNEGLYSVYGKYGSSVIIPENPSRQGYNFIGWGEELSETFGLEDKTFTAEWEADSNTSYKVEHYQQNIENDEYTLVSADTENKKGTTGGLTSAQAKTYQGFTAQTFEQASILADGSRVIKIFYERNTITYNFNSADGKFSDNSKSKIVSGKFGADVSKPANPELIGYSFKGWNEEVPETFGAEDKNFTAEWQANT